MQNFDPKKMMQDVSDLAEKVAQLSPLIPLVQPLVAAYERDVAGQGMTLESSVAIPAEQLGKYEPQNDGQ
jgi:hypothetical protein